MDGAEQPKLRQYLLGQLTEAEDEQVELRLLSDPEFAEEYDMVVNEITDDYIAGSLAGEELKQVERHFFQSPERRNRLKFAQALKVRKSEIKTGKARKSWLRPYLAIAASLVLAVGAFYVWRMQSKNSELNKGLAALQSAYREQRPFEARISTFVYAPYATTRGPGTDRVDQNELQLAELTLRQALKTNETPAVHHGLGKVLLAKKHFDDAIKEFDEALKGDPNNAQLYSDLGAAWLEKAKTDLGKDPAKGMEEMGRSLENLSHALELNPNLLEARFNRALSRQYQNLYNESEADWREYLKRDSSSQWAAEATQNLKLIQEKKVDSFAPHSSLLETFLSAYRARDEQAAWEIYRRGYGTRGNAVTRELLDGFLRESGSGDASEYLSAFEYVGQMQVRRVGDLFDADRAKIYRSASPKTRNALLQARYDINKGYELFGQSKIKDSYSFFLRARDSFNSVGSNGEALLAEYAIAHGATVEPDLEKSKQIFVEIIPISEAKGYKWLAAQCLLERAHLHANLNNYSEAIDDNNRALTLLAELDDSNGTVDAIVQLAGLHLFLNDSEQSLSLLRRGFAMIESDLVPRTRLWGMYIAAALNFNNLALHRSAHDYHQEALTLAVASKIPLYISRSYQYLGLTYGKLNLYEEGIENLRLAYDQGQRLAGERTGQNMMASASLNLGDLRRIFGDQPRALAAYDESISLYEKLGFGHYSYAAHKGKFLSHLVGENYAQAAQELSIVLSLFEDYRQRILEERQRSFFFDREQDVYDLAIDFAYSRDRDEKRAFEYSEASRGRSLLDLLRHGGLVVERNGRTDLRMPASVAEPVDADDLISKMPERAQILQYAMLKDHLVIWVINKFGLTARRVPVDSKRLTQEVTRSLSLISGGNESETASQLMVLHDILIRPIDDLLRQDKLLCIVPDKELNYLPFAALISSRSGRYLVQDFQLTLSPSSSVFLHCTEIAQDKTAGEEHLLAVGNPTFDRRAYTEYADLAAAEREAAKVGALYKSRRVLTGRHATVEAVTAELLRADVAHFAAHYVIDPKSPLSSRLLLATSGTKNNREETGELEARDVCRMNLSRTRLVVLSACETGIERQYRGEGPVSFARQFMIAGVPLVVASLWPVESEATADLMIAFEQYRTVDNLPTAEALQRAQQEMIISKNPNYRRPYFWASFMTIGGYAEF
ncbi:MAG TPA: CHAT domain-containing protein [Pyrinomonadaceae bacterium]|nr:CHAT domain-containing protein [Pyrinomonadaceae bacterium]